MSQNDPVADFRLLTLRHRRSVSTTLNVGELLNLVGLSTGVVLYTMLLAMVVRAGRAPGLNSRFDPLLLLTSLLGLIWNLCALPAYELPKMGFQGPFPSLVAAGFGALGFLPAVVVHSVLQRRAPGHPRRAETGTGSRRVRSERPRGGASRLRRMDGGRGAICARHAAADLHVRRSRVPLGAVTRGQPGSRRALWAAALATFAVSALHLSQLHRGDTSWPVELVGHHASLPLAFAILYQDYRFALADLFLKRALALLAIVAVAFAAIATFGLRSVRSPQFVQVDPRQVSILVTFWVATALLYPLVRQATAWFVDTIVLHRPDYPSLRAMVARTSQAYGRHSDAAVELSAIARTRVERGVRRVARAGGDQMTTRPLVPRSSVAQKQRPSSGQRQESPLGASSPPWSPCRRPIRRDL